MSQLMVMIMMIGSWWSPTSDARQAPLHYVRYYVYDNLPVDQTTHKTDVLQRVSYQSQRHKAYPDTNLHHVMAHAGV